MSTVVADAVEQTLGVSPLAQLVVDGDGRLLVASEKARELLGLPPGAEGLPFEALARECGGTELAELVLAAIKADAPLTFAERCWTPGSGEPRLLNGGIVAMRDGEGRLLGVTVTLERSDGMDLSRYNDELKRDVHELRYINDELRLRTDELNLVAIFLESVLTSLRGAVVVIDTRLVVRVWNPQSERLWGIPRREAMGKSLPLLDLRVPFTELEPCVARALGGEVEGEDLSVLVRRDDGMVTDYSVSATPLLGPGSSVHGATLLFVEHSTRS